MVQRIFCLSPFVRSGNQLATSTSLTVYSWIVIVGYVVAIAASIVQINANGFDWLDLSQGYLWIIIVCFELFFTIVTFPILLVYCQYAKQLQMQTLMKIVHLDQVLIDEFDANFNPVYLRQMISQRVEIFIWSSYFAYIYVVLHGVLHKHGLTLLGFYTFALAYVLEQYVSGLLFWSISNSASILRSKFAMLKQIQQHVHRHPYTNATVTKRKLSTLMSTFKDICAIIDLISQSVGSMCVLRVAHDFTLMTSQCYLIYYFMTESGGTVEFVPVMNIMIWMLQNVVRIGMIAFTMSWTVDEVSIWRSVALKL